MTECPDCHKDFKNLGVHKRYCKESKQTIENIASQSSDPAGTILKEQATIISPSEQFNPSIIHPADDPYPPGIKGFTKEYIADKKSFIDKVLHRNTPKKPEKKPVTIEEMLTKLPKWSIKDKKPFFSPKTKGNSWVQFVGFSRTRPPVMCWLEYDGESLSVNDLYFPAPHDVRGGIFAYDLDKGIPLLENSEDFKEMSYWNKLVFRVKNMYFTLGLVTGAGDFTKNIGLILLLVAIVGLIGIVNLYMTWSLSTGLAASQAQATNLSIALNDYMITHP